MRSTLTGNIQDYLKSIYSLTRDGRQASTSQLAARLRIRPASVTGMLKKMATSNPPLIHYQRHYGATLTQQGERAALEILRLHRLIEYWLVESLGYPQESVHAEACRLEHVISKDLERRIDEALGHPARDPHGSPIPTADLTMPVSNEAALDSIPIGFRVVFKGISCKEPGMVTALTGLGLIQGETLQILPLTSSNEISFRRMERKQMVTVKRDEAKHILVENLNEFPKDEDIHPENS